VEAGLGALRTLRELGGPEDVFGILLRRSRSTFEQMDFVSHFRDLLIASEAMRTEATLVTENPRDFARWKLRLASARKTLKLFNPS